MTSTTRRILATAASLSYLAAAAAASANAAMPPARYQVVFERTWSEATHPQDFPLLAHFSPVIGLTHDGDYEPFRAGAAPSAGHERLCEEARLDGLGHFVVGDGDEVVVHDRSCHHQSGGYPRWRRSRPI